MKLSSELLLAALAFTAAHAVNSNNLRLTDSKDFEDDDLDNSLDVDTDDYNLLLADGKGSGFQQLDNSGAWELDTNPSTKSGDVDAIASKGDPMSTDVYSKSDMEDSVLTDLTTYPKGDSTVTDGFTDDSSSFLQDPELLKLLNQFGNKLENGNTNIGEKDDSSGFDLFEQDTDDTLDTQSSDDLDALLGLQASDDLGSLDDDTMQSTPSTLHYEEFLKTITGSQLEDMDQGSDDALIMMKDGNDPATKDSLDNTEDNYPLQMNDDLAFSTSNDDYDSLSTKFANSDDIFDIDDTIDDNSNNALLLDDKTNHYTTGGLNVQSIGSGSSQSFTELMKSLGLSGSSQFQDLGSSNDDDLWMKDDDNTLTSPSNTDDAFDLTDDEAEVQDSILTKDVATKGRAPVMDESSLDGDSPLQITPTQTKESAVQLQ